MEDTGFTIEVLRDLRVSEHSDVRLVRGKGTRLAVRKEIKADFVDFLREVCVHQVLATAAPARFPNVLEVVPSEQFLTLEMCENYSLEEATVASGLPPVQQLVSELVRAVQVMHLLSLAHGDVQPRHVLVTEKCEIKLTGFRATRFCRASEQLRRDLVGVAKTVLHVVARERPADVQRTLRDCPPSVENALKLMLEERQPTTAADVLRILGIDEPVESSHSEAREVSLAHSEVSLEDLRRRLLLKLVQVRSLVRPFPEAEIQDLLREAAGANCSVSVRPSPQSRCAACSSLYIPRSLAKLPCTHSFCVNCLNSHLAQSQKYSDICCWNCSLRFDPLADSLAQFRGQHVTIALTERKLKEECEACPKCTHPFAVENEKFSPPIALKCPHCSFSFCCYCRRRSHNFCCSKFKKDCKCPRR